MTIKAKFRGKTIELENRSKVEGNILADWNGYQILFRKYGKQKKIVVKSPLDDILIKQQCENIQKAIKLAFERIETDVAENEYMVKDKIFLLASTNGSFQDRIKKAEEFLKNFSY